MKVKISPRMPWHTVPGPKAPARQQIDKGAATACTMCGLKAGLA